jgi:cobalt/nickel transport system ATP-binding protein
MTKQASTNESPPAPALRIAGLHFSYSPKRSLLQDINLTIHEGERVGFIGPNGAGKTTLFLLACGVLKPDSGEIALFGQELTPGQFHPEIGMIFQDADDQLFSPSVWDDVAFGPQNLALPPEQIDARVEEALLTAGVLDLAQRTPHHLSAGEKRMVAIAGVLAMQPRLMIYDEPSASLDIRSRRRLIDYLQDAPETQLISSHDLEFVLEVCDRVVLLDGGRLIVDGAPDEIMADVALMEAHGLEKPHSLIPHSVSHH